LEILTERLLTLLDKAIRVHGANFYYWHQTSVVHDYQKRLNIAEKNEYRLLAEAVIFYLERISEINIEDDLRVFHKVQSFKRLFTQQNKVTTVLSRIDVQRFEEYRDELFSNITSLEGLVRRISVLDDDLVKRASVTPVLRRKLDKSISSPFASAVALLDSIHHFCLVIAFRSGPAKALFCLSKDGDPFNPNIYVVANVILISNIIYFATRTFYLNIANYSLSQQLFWSDVFSQGMFLDTVPLIMALFCALQVDILLRRGTSMEIDNITTPNYARIAVALTTPALWFRILRYIKTRNKHLSTVVLCFTEILRDIKWFMVVLGVIMITFAQMWLSLTYEPGKKNSYFVSSAKGYLKAYTMMLGDLGDGYIESHVLSIVFIAYTFVVTTVLLNILIAIVSDSYQNAFISSTLMHGKARIHFYSELHSIKAYFRMVESGELRNFSVRLFLPNIFLAAAFTYRIVGTASAKSALCRVADGRLTVKAALVFTILFYLLLWSEFFMGSLTNDTVPTSSIKSLSTIHMKLYWLAIKLSSYLKFTFDSLNDEGDRSALQLEGNTDDKSTPSALRSYKKLHRSLQNTRKDLKQQLKTTVEQLQVSLQETEDRMQQNMDDVQQRFAMAVASIIAESEDRVIDEIEDRLYSVRTPHVENGQAQANGDPVGEMPMHVSFAPENGHSNRNSTASIHDLNDTSLSIRSLDLASLSPPPSMHRSRNLSTSSRQSSRNSSTSSRLSSRSLSTNSLRVSGSDTMQGSLDRDMNFLSMIIDRLGGVDEEDEEEEDDYNEFGEDIAGDIAENIVEENNVVNETQARPRVRKNVHWGDI